MKIKNERSGRKSRGFLMTIKTIGILLSCGIALTGCSVLDILVGKPDVRHPDPTPQTLPNVRSIIVNSRDTLFDATANARNIVISKEVRRFDVVFGDNAIDCCLQVDDR